MASANPYGTINAFGPTPGGTLGSVPGPGIQREGQAQSKLDARVKWAIQTANTLYTERAAITAQMRRAMDLYRGKHWVFNRAPWKAASRINYCQWVPEHWAAILSDNKPRASFTTYRQEDHWQADIATAAFEEWYSQQEVQRVIEDTIKMSRIVKKAYMRLVYDPYAQGGRGDQRVTCVPGWQVYANKNSTTVDDATLLLYEAVEPEGEVLSRYPHLKGKLTSAERRGYDQFSDDGELQQAPRQFVDNTSQPGGTSYHLDSYEGPAAPDGGGTGGVVVREFWTRPRGPKSKIDIELPVWNALNRPATEARLIEFEDGHTEPLYLVMMGDNTTYELPYSVLRLLRYAETLGAQKVLKDCPSLEPIYETIATSLYPTGRRLVIVGSEVAEDTCNPFAHGEWPFIEVDAYRDPTRMYGISDVDLIADLQEYLNRIYSLLLDAAYLTSNPVWLIPESSDLTDDEITNAPGAIIRVDPMFLKYANSGRKSGPEMPQYVKELLTFTIAQIREISGLTDIATGGKMKGQQAAETVSMYQEAAGVRFRQGIRSVERAIIKLGRQFIRNVAQFYGQPRLIRIESSVGMDREVPFLGSSLTAELDLKVKAGSMLPTSPSARLNQLFQTLNLPFPAIDIPTLFGVMEEYGIINDGDRLLDRLQKLGNQVGLQGEAWKWPIMWTAAMGGGKGKAKGNSGRTARQKTPNAQMVR